MRRRRRRAAPPGANAKIRRSRQPAALEDQDVPEPPVPHQHRRQQGHDGQLEDERGQQDLVGGQESWLHGRTIRLYTRPEAVPRGRQSRKWYDRPYVREFVIGFATTFKHIFRKPITVSYPTRKCRCSRSTGASRCSCGTRTAWRSAWRAACAPWRVRPTPSTSRRPRTMAVSRRGRDTRRCTRFTRRGASSVATARRPVPFPRHLHG